MQQQINGTAAASLLLPAVHNWQKISLLGIKNDLGLGLLKFFRIIFLLCFVSCVLFVDNILQKISSLNRDGG